IRCLPCDGRSQIPDVGVDARIEDVDSDTIRCCAGLEPSHVFDEKGSLGVREREETRCPRYGRPREPEMVGADFLGRGGLRHAGHGDSATRAVWLPHRDGEDGYTL